MVGDEAVVVMAPAYYGDLLKVTRPAYRGAVETQLATVGSATPGHRPGVDNAHDAGWRTAAVPQLSGSVDAVTYAFVAISPGLSRWAPRHAGSGTRAPAL